MLLASEICDVFIFPVYPAVCLLSFRKMLNTDFQNGQARGYSWGSYYYYPSRWRLNDLPRAHMADKWQNWNLNSGNFLPHQCIVLWSFGLVYKIDV